MSSSLPGSGGRRDSAHADVESGLCSAEGILDHLRRRSPGKDEAQVAITFGEGASPGQVSFTGELTAGVPARVSAQLLLEILRFDEEDTLGSIRLPTTVIVGDHDLMTPVAQARAMVAAIPGARLLLLPGCGHMVMLERRREVDEALAGGRPAWQVA